jgi:hypothetical protein
MNKNYWPQREPETPDLLPSTRRPLHPARLQTSIRPHHGISPAAADPFKFAHLSRDVSSTLAWHDGLLSMMNPIGKLMTAAIAIVAS